MWVWLKPKLTPKGDFCEVSLTGFFLFANFFMHSLKRYLNEQTTEVRPKSANDEHPLHFCMGVLLGKQITICST